MALPKEHYQTLRSMYRNSEYRRFRARHRSGRYAEILGFGPDGKVFGFWEGQDEPTRFEPDVIEWTQLTVYV